MKQLSLTLTCTVCHALAAYVGGDSLRDLRGMARRRGWRLGAVQDICIDCYEKGHRP